MIKVFLAEDEFVIREGIKNTIDWGAHGYEFCGEAGDGELAWSMIRKEQPDIVITDIKMPFMDGLTLSRHIKAQFPQIEIILLTGYEEFEYAKEAVRIGAARYLSKPISGEELIGELDALSGKIRERRQEREAAAKYAEEMRERTELDKREFFRDLVTGGRELSALLDDAGRLGLDITALWYNVLLIRISSAAHRGEERYSESVLTAEQALAGIAEEAGALLFDLSLDGKALLFREESEDALEQLVAGTVGKLKECLNAMERVRYFGGVGKSVGRISELPVSYTEAARVFARRFFTEKNEIRYAKGASDGEGSAFSLSAIDPAHFDRRQLRAFLDRGDAAETEYFLDAFFDGLGEGALDSMMFRQYIVMDTYFCVADYAEHELHRNRAEAGVHEPEQDALADPDSARTYVLSIVKSVMKCREEAATDRYHDTVQEALRFIEEHYAEEELNLNALAAHVNFSPNHLSAIFKQQTGQPFIKYLTDLRMNEAKKYLRSSAKKSSEIGLLVGYRDPHYFSYLFKKTQGMTPTQYRNAQGAEAL